MTATPRKSPAAGIAALVVSVVLCAASHLMLRSAATGHPGGTPLELLFSWRILFALSIYAAGTLLWLFCLSRIDLSLAFPGSALQFILVLSGASFLLGEQISPLQLAGSAIILTGIALLFLDRGKRHV